MPKNQAMPSKGEDVAGTYGEAEESAAESYDGGDKAPDGGRDLGRKDPQQSGDNADKQNNVRQR